jgi:hypothetical protein
MTSPETGIQHRVWMTGNQPGQDQPLPRPALLPNVPLVFYISTYVLIVKKGAVGMNVPETADARRSSALL